MTNQGNKQSTSGENKQNKNQSPRSNQDQDPGARKAFKKQDMPDTDDDESEMESDLDPNSPEKTIQIDDNPEGTKRKIPH